MNTIPLSELEKIPYLKLDVLGGRVAQLKPLWDGEKWSIWIQGAEELILIHPLDTSKSFYVAKEEAHSEDIYIYFVDLMWQRAGYHDIIPIVSHICDDFSNMGISLAKMRHIFNTRTSIKTGEAGNFITTEIEYLLVLARSVFDFLYEIIKRFWENYVRLNDEEAEKKRLQRKLLPKKLSSFILNDGVPKSAIELEDKYAIPALLALEFEKRALFFSELRTARDKIVHHGVSIDTVYTTEKGFCVQADRKPFSSFYESRDCKQYSYNENLVSLSPWLSHIVLGTIDACNGIVSAFSAVIALPPEIAPGYKIFIRDPSGNSLINALDVEKGGSPWW